MSEFKIGERVLVEQEDLFIQSIDKRTTPGSIAPKKCDEGSIAVYLDGYNLIARQGPLATCIEERKIHKLGGAIIFYPSLGLTHVRGGDLKEWCPNKTIPGRLKGKKYPESKPYECLPNDKDTLLKLDWVSEYRRGVIVSEGKCTDKNTVPVKLNGKNYPQSKPYDCLPQDKLDPASVGVMDDAEEVRDPNSPLPPDIDIGVEIIERKK